MNQIRDIYNKSKKYAKDKPQKITKEICNRMIALINTQANNMEANNDFRDIQELLTYREQFQSILQAYEQKLKKQDLYSRIRTILQDHSLPAVQQKSKQQDLGYFNYFNTKRNQIQKSKIGFDTILGNVPSINKRFLKKPQEQSKVRQAEFSIQNNELRELKQEISKLKHKLNQSEKDQKSHRLQQQNKNLKNHIQALQTQIQKAKDQNILLKDKIKNKSQSSFFKDQQQQQIIMGNQLNNYQPQQQIAKYFINPPKKIYKQSSNNRQQTKKEQLSNYSQATVKRQIPLILPKNRISNQNDYQLPSKRYQINYLPNDISKLKEKFNNNQQTDKSKQILSQYLVKNKQQSIKQIQPQSKIKEIESDLFHKQKPQMNKDRNLQLKQQKDRQLPKNPSSSLLFKTSSNHKFNRSQVYDQAKNIAIRSKISFFKPSMIIYRGKEFQVAVKAIDEQRLLSKRILIYINNKEQTGRQVKLTYKFNPDYYEVKSIKKISFINAKCQEKQELFVKLLNSDNFDNIIEVQLTINTKTIHFLLPTMFINFIQKRPNRSKRTPYQKQKVHPIHQYSNIHLAQQILPIETVHNQPYSTGRVYGISRYYQGYIYFRWIEGKLEVETIAPWKLFISYLLLKDF